MSSHASTAAQVAARALFAAVFFVGCTTGGDGGAPTGSGGSASSGGATSSGGVSSGGTTSSGGSASSGGATSSGGSVSSGGTTGMGGVSSTGGTTSSGGTGGAAGMGGTRAASGGVGGLGSGGAGTGGSPVATGGTGANDCKLSTPVSFKKDVEPFLTTSCGKGVGGGCHVTDAMSTPGGFDHAYDWITAGSHASSCPETPNPKRFEVAIAVIQHANPATCSRSRIMPPGMGTPLTACQIAALQAWIDEPKVVQMHRADDSSPTTPYAMPPYN